MMSLLVRLICASPVGDAPHPAAPVIRHGCWFGAFASEMTMRIIGSAVLQNAHHSLPLPMISTIAQGRQLFGKTMVK
jgi:hypothetical protein